MELLDKETDFDASENSPHNSSMYTDQLFASITEIELQGEISLDDFDSMMGEPAQDYNGHSEDEITSLGQLDNSDRHSDEFGTIMDEAEEMSIHSLDDVSIYSHLESIEGEDTMSLHERNRFFRIIPRCMEVKICCVDLWKRMKYRGSIKAVRGTCQNMLSRLGSALLRCIGKPFCRVRKKDSNRGTSRVSRVFTQTENSRVQSESNNESMSEIEPKTEEKTNEIKTEEPKTDEAKTEDPKPEEKKKNDAKIYEKKTDDTKTGEPKTLILKKDEPTKDETNEPFIVTSSNNTNEASTKAMPSASNKMSSRRLRSKSIKNASKKVGGKGKSLMNPQKMASTSSQSQSKQQSKGGAKLESSQMHQMHAMKSMSSRRTSQMRSSSSVGKMCSGIRQYSPDRNSRGRGWEGKKIVGLNDSRSKF